MISSFFWIAVLIASLYALVRSAEYFVSCSEKLGKTLRMTPFITGVILISVGTTLPEFATSVSSLYLGKGELIFGTILGTMIANILLLLGLASVLLKKEFLKTDWDFTLGDFPAFIFTVFLVFLTLMDGKLVWYESILFLLALIIHFKFLHFVYKKSKEKMEIPKEKLNLKTPLVIAVSLIIVIFSAKFCVQAVINIASIFRLAESALAASIIAVGTSLPELSCIFAAVKMKNYDLAFGNAIGASVFGVLAVFGIGGLFSTLIVPSIILSLVVPTLILATIFFWVLMQDRQITHYEGWLMLILYALFIIKLFSAY